MNKPIGTVLILAKSQAKKLLTLRLQDLGNGNLILAIDDSQKLRLAHNQERQPGAIRSLTPR